MEHKLSKFIRGFPESSRILKFLNKYAKGKRECVCCSFMGLPKAFETINPDLLLAKLKVYSFSVTFLALLYSYLKNTKQRTQINSCFSSGKGSLLQFHKALSMDHYDLIHL